MAKRNPIVTKLAVALNLIADCGYVSNKQSRETGEPSTKEQLTNALINGATANNKAHKKAAEIIAYFVDDFTPGTDNDFEQKLANVFVQNGKPQIDCPASDFAFLACAPKVAERGLKAGTYGGSIGTAGETIMAENVTVTGVRSTKWNKEIVTFEAQYENALRVFTWFTANPKCAAGDIVHIDKAEIKGHREWQGVAQTQLKFVKLTHVG